MDHLDIEIRNTCIFTIANFSSNTNNHPFILKENCIPKLVYLTTTSDKNAQVYIYANFFKKLFFFVVYRVYLYI